MFLRVKVFFQACKVGFLSFLEGIGSFFKRNKEKLNHLYQTNYNTGMYHLEKGNVWDAIFRFKIIQKFWPDKLEAQCKYALCLILNEMNDDSERLLNDILIKDPNLEEAKDLLSKIKEGKTANVIREYREKVNKNSLNLNNSENVVNKEINIVKNDSISINEK